MTDIEIPTLSIETLDVSVLVSGCGSIGMRHIRNLRNLGITKLSACDPNRDRISDAVLRYGVIGHNSLEQALDAGQYDAVVVCTPPTLLLSQANSAIESGSHLFIEKPLAHNTDGVESLINKASMRNLKIQVGYNFRFQRGLSCLKKFVEQGKIGRVLWARDEVGNYLPDWRPDSDYRQTYSANKSMGGGIVLDAAHEIDYMRWIFGEVDQVYCVAGTFSDLEVDVEDTASMILRFESGMLGEIHLDFIQRVFSRTCKVVGTEGTVEWGAFDKFLRIFTTKSNMWNEIEVAADPNEKYVLELASFLSNTNKGSDLESDGISGHQTLKLAMAALESARTNQSVKIT